MMLRQEAALDRSIDRKVRMLLRLGKEFANLPSASPDQDDGTRMKSLEEAPNGAISSENSGSLIRDVGPGLAPAKPPQGAALQSTEVVEDAKMNDRCGNVYENKRPRLGNQGTSGNVRENKGSYAQNAGMLLTTKEIDGTS
jgi:hypothetical protein